MVGPAIGPVIGGALSDKLGWRSIFWFLTISSSICLIMILLVLPETLRALVGNGSVVPPPIYRPVFPIIGHGRRNVTSHTATIQPVSGFRNPFRLLFNIDILILLAANGIICSIYNGVIATISTLLGPVYPFLNETKIGLCFLGIGGGMIIGSSVTGRVLDREYQTFKRKQEIKSSSNPVNTQAESREDNFPIEKARLRLLPYLIVLLAATCAAYGWCLQKRVNLAGPLILQIVVGDRKSVV